MSFLTNQMVEDNITKKQLQKLVGPAMVAMTGQNDPTIEGFLDSQGPAGSKILGISQIDDMNAAARRRRRRRLSSGILRPVAAQTFLLRVRRRGG